MALFTGILKRHPTGNADLTDIEKYERPASLAEAVTLLREGGVTILAGGTDLMPQTQEGVRAFQPVLMNITRIPELRGIEDGAQAIRIGALGIAASPCETFVETGLAIKSASPLRPTFTIELANDYAGYLPTPEHHRLGGYETWRARSSYLDAKAEPKMRKEILKLLGQVAKSG